MHRAGSATEARVRDSCPAVATEAPPQSERSHSLQAQPVRGRQHENGQPAAGQVLLVLEVAVRRYEDVEFLFGPRQQLAIAELGPAEVKGSADVMTAQMLAKRHGNTLI